MNTPEIVSAIVFSAYANRLNISNMNDKELDEVLNKSVEVASRLIEMMQQKQKK